MEYLRQPWPWWISGPLIGLFVPVLLLAGNKSFGVSASLRDMCAAVIPSRVEYFPGIAMAAEWHLTVVVWLERGSYPRVICELLLFSL